MFLLSSSARTRKPTGHMIDFSVAGSDSPANPNFGIATDSPAPAVAIFVHKAWNAFDSGTSSYTRNQTTVDWLFDRLDEAQAAGMQLGLCIEYRADTTDSPQNKPVPTHLIAHQDQYNDDMYAAKIYEYDCVDAWRAMIADLAVAKHSTNSPGASEDIKLKDHPNFCGFMFQSGDILGTNTETDKWADLDYAPRETHTYARVEILRFMASEFPNNWIIGLEGHIAGQPRDGAWRSYTIGGITYPAVTGSGNDFWHGTALQYTLNAMMLSNPSNYVFAGSDIMPGNNTMIDDNREKGYQRSVETNTFWQKAIKGQMRSLKDLQYTGDGTTGTGTYTTGYPPFSGGTYHTVGDTTYWAQEHNLCDIIFHPYTSDSPGNIYADAKAVITAQPRWTPPSNIIEDSADFTTGNWSRINLDLPVVTSDYDEDYRDHIQGDDSTLLIETYDDGVTSNQHSISQTISSSKFKPNTRYAIVWPVGNCSGLDPAGYSRAAKIRMKNTSGDTYKGIFNVNGANEGNLETLVAPATAGAMYDLYAYKAGGSENHGAGMKYCYLEFDSGDLSQDAQIALKIRNTTEEDQSYVGDPDNDNKPSLILGECKVFEAIRPYQAYTEPVAAVIAGSHSAQTYSILEELFASGRIQDASHESDDSPHWDFWEVTYTDSPATSVTDQV